MGQVLSFVFPLRVPSVCTTLSGYVALQTRQYTSCAIRSAPLQSQQLLRIVQRDAPHSQHLSPRGRAADDHHVARSYPQTARHETHESGVRAALVRRRLESYSQTPFGHADKLVAPPSRADPERKLDAVLDCFERPALTT